MSLKNKTFNLPIHCIPILLNILYQFTDILLYKERMNRMKIPKTSSVKKNRIRNSFVERNTAVRNTDGVEAVTPIKQIRNTSYYSSENHLLSFDSYYDSLKELKKEYKKFYHDEQQLEKAIENFDKQKEELLQNMKELIEKYNNAILSLVSFDKAFDTNNTDKIVGIIYRYEDNLKNLGIYIQNNNELYIDEEIFTRKIKNSENALDFLFEPTKGLVLKLYTAFKNIRAPKKDGLDTKFKDTYYTGILIDNKT